ncbi:hypothetical protein LOC68_24655 [Blastopirellula sp. JC732]|uniref:Uncharacterized protein n=1 Tax=Blastopirellula sediminis TaxID=2894196 RepID=A0A9X1SHU0_9BACT|nr:hypothetical protein [Blastopirellula sediminis]MCC9605100.1 hypothetical protein [Blastopirellula sediminis]MCC9631600.1 hypothetical protein [Blastopirellula sediminis]
MTNRWELGGEKVGEPIMALRDAVNALRSGEFEGVRIDAIDHYIELFLMSFVPSIIDESLSDQQLEALDPDTVKQASFLLLANAIMQLRNKLAKSEKLQADSEWHERLIRHIAGLAQIEESPYVEFALRPPGVNLVNDPLISGLSQKMNVEIAKFFIIQPAMIEVVVEDVLGGKSDDDDDDDDDLDGLDD